MRAQTDPAAAISLTGAVTRATQRDRTKVGPTRTRRDARRAHKTPRLSSYALTVLGALQDRPVFAGTSVRRGNTRKHNHGGPR